MATSSGQRRGGRDTNVAFPGNGSVRAYLASIRGARSAANDLHRRFKFLGDTGVWRQLTTAARDL